MWSDELPLILERIECETMLLDLSGIRNSQEWWAKYDAYRATSHWQKKRITVLERDGYECRICGEGEEYGLEVHHKLDAYSRLGQELPTDLITVCKPCHDQITSVIRERRYSKRQISVSDVKRQTPINNIKENHNGNTEVEVEDTRRFTPVNAQWSTGRPDEFYRQENQTHLRQTPKD